MNNTDQKAHMNDLASRLPAPLGNALRASAESAAPPAPPPSSAALAPERWVRFAPQVPSAGGQEP